MVVALISLGGCAAATVQTWTIPNPVPASTAPTSPAPTSPAPTSTTSTPISSTAPVTAVPVACGGGNETDEPASSSLDRLLLTVSDLPHGYISSGPDGATSSLVFGGELPRSVPVAAITYGEDSDVASGVATERIDESLAQDTSAPAASDLAVQLQGVTAGCVSGSTTVHLPGTVPNLIATTSLRSQVPTTLAGSQSEDISSAVVYASKGPYLVEVSWDNTLDIFRSGPAPQPALPTPSVMGSVVDAALAHLPG